jgi:TolA-binding protein
MRWLMNWSPSISLRCAAGVCGLVALLFLSVVRAPAQDVEQRYQQAVEFFNSAKMEEACELLQQIEKQSPGYKQTKTYMSAACRQVPILYEREQKLFNEGVQFFNQGDYEGAKQRFDQAAKVPVKNPKYRSQISGYLNQIQGRENEERLFQEGVKLFDAGNYSQAQSRLNQVAQAGGSKAGEARALLGRINDALGKQRAEEETNRLFNDGVQLFKAGNNAEAFYKFDQVAKAGGSKAAEARNYLQRIEQANRAAQQPPKPLPKPPEPEPTKPGPETPKPAATEQTLRAGLRAYFEGDVNAAERDLSDYLDTKGPKQALAYFFRGAARSTRYLLSGEKDAEQKKLAGEDFRAFKSQAARLQPPEKFVSPKILALYSEAVGAP